MISLSIQGYNVKDAALTTNLFIICKVICYSTSYALLYAENVRVVRTKTYLRGTQQSSLSFYVRMFLLFSTMQSIPLWRNDNTSPFRHNLLSRQNKRQEDMTNSSPSSLLVTLGLKRLSNSMDASFKITLAIPGIKSEV